MSLHIQNGPFSLSDALKYVGLFNCWLLEVQDRLNEVAQKSQSPHSLKVSITSFRMIPHPERSYELKGVDFSLEVTYLVPCDNNTWKPSKVKRASDSFSCVQEDSLDPMHEGAVFLEEVLHKHVMSIVQEMYQGLLETSMVSS